MSETTFIYALKCPETGRIRYIGKADNPTRRFKAHRYRTKNPTHNACWILGLKKRGLKPKFEILDEVPKAQWEFWEQEYIRIFKLIGFNLTNLSDGGGGPTNIFYSPERRKKQSESLKRAYANGTKIAWSKGKTLTEEHRKKQSSGLKSAYSTGKRVPYWKGRKHTDKYKEKMSSVKSGVKPYVMTATTRNKIGEAAKGRKWTPEQRQKIIAALPRGPKNRHFGVKYFGVNAHKNNPQKEVLFPCASQSS